MGAGYRAAARERGRRWVAVRPGLTGRVGVPRGSQHAAFDRLAIATGCGGGISDNWHDPWRRDRSSIPLPLLEARTPPLSTL